MPRVLVACVLLATIAGCKGDQQLGTFDAPPQATFLAPADGDSFSEGTTVLLRGSASDPDDRTEDLLGRFMSSGAPLCDEAAPGGIGEVRCEVTLAPAHYDVTFEVRDLDGATDSDAIAFTVVANQSPTVAILSPATDTQWEEGQTIAFAAHVADAESPATDLVAQWSSDVDVVLDVDDTPDASGNLSGFGTLSAGDHVITLAVSDPEGNETDASVAIAVRPANRPPTCVITAPADGGHSSQGESVAFTGTVGDPDQGPDGLVVTWATDQEGAPFATSVPDGTGAVAASRDDLAAATHRITLRAVDNGGLDCTDQLTWSVGSPPHIAIQRPNDADVFDVGVPIAFGAVATDGETPAAGLTVAWTSDRDGLLGQGTPDALGQSALSTDHLTAGIQVVTATVTDGDGLYASDSVTFRVNALPSSPTVTLAPSTPLTGDDLQATITVPSIDPEGATVTMAYAWYRDGVLSSASSSATLPSSATARGETWRVEATPSDGHGSGASGVASVVIGNTPPVTGVPTLSPLPPTKAAPIVCAPGATTDADGPMAWTYRYEWRVHGSVVGETSSALPPSAFVKGDEVICSVAASDGTAFGALTPSLPATVANSAPTLGTPIISPIPAFTNSVLTVSAPATDLDGDGVAWGTAWKKNGVNVGNMPSLDGATAFARGDRMTVTLTPTDGALSGPPMTSAELVISNSPPTAPVVSVSPREPVVDEDPLVCSVGTEATDPDGDPLTTTYTWTVDGVVYGTPGAPVTIDRFAPGAGELWQCSVAANDGTITGPAGSDSVREELYGHVQWPCPGATGTPGQTGFAFYGVVYDPDSTPGPGPGSGVTKAQVGIGPTGTDPRTAPGWTWFNGTYNKDIDAFAYGDMRNDEYVALATLPTTRGSYDYAWKFEAYGVAWTYVDLGTSFGVDGCDAFVGNSDGYSPATAGKLTVQ